MKNLEKLNEFNKKSVNVLFKELLRLPLKDRVAYAAAMRQDMQAFAEEYFYYCPEGEILSQELPCGFYADLGNKLGTALERGYAVEFAIREVDPEAREKGFVGAVSSNFSVSYFRGENGAIDAKPPVEMLEINICNNKHNNGPKEK